MGTAKQLIINYRDYQPGSHVVDGEYFCFETDRRTWVMREEGVEDSAAVALRHVIDSLERGDSLRIVYEVNGPQKGISDLAWRILYTLMQARYEHNLGYLAEWNIDKALNLDYGQWSWKYPHTPVDHAVRELIDRGLIEEMSDLGCRYRLIEKEG